MDPTIAGIVQQMKADPEAMRQIERKRDSQKYIERYRHSPTHEWFGKLSRELGTVDYNLTFTETDNSALIATYDFYLAWGVWFQIVYELADNGTATIRVSDKDGHKTWEGEDLAILWGYIISAYRNPKTEESVIGTSEA